MEDLLTKATTLLSAPNVIVLAGAGMSAELGSAVYYGGAGTTYGSSVSEYGYTAFEHANASLWYNEQESQLKYFRDRWYEFQSIDPAVAASPYKILLDWLEGEDKDWFVATSNVDSAFLRTGFSADRLHEIHGSYRLSQCLDKPTGHGVFPTTNPELGTARCVRCGADARPNALFFDDWSFNNDYVADQYERFVEFIQAKKGKPTVVLEIGAGETVSTLRNFSQDFNTFYGFDVIRINPDKDTTPFRNLGRPGKPAGKFLHSESGVNEFFATVLEQ